MLLVAGSIGQAGDVLPSPLKIEVGADVQQVCIFKVEGRSNSEFALRKMLDSETDKKRAVHIISSRQAPWRCVAGAISIAQSSGFESVGFVSEPISK
jgi:biopolymer transport protein ExbD